MACIEGRSWQGGDWKSSHFCPLRMRRTKGEVDCDPLLDMASEEFFSFPLFVFEVLLFRDVPFKKFAARPSSLFKTLSDASSENAELVKLLTRGEGGALRCRMGSGARSGAGREGENGAEVVLVFVGRKVGLPFCR